MFLLRHWRFRLAFQKPAGLNYFQKQNVLEIYPQFMNRASEITLFSSLRNLKDVSK